MVPPARGENGTQAEVLHFLEHAGLGSDPSGPPQRIDTHISTVFLCGDAVYKLKKSVDFGYLDFSTLEKRRWACEREVALNRRTAPDLYLGLCAVTRERDGTFALDGAGEPVEWLVRMRRFTDVRLGSRLADQGLLGEEQAAALGRTIAGFHDRLAPAAGGGREGLSKVLASNRDRLRDHVPAVFSEAAVSSLADASTIALDRLAVILDGRAERGLVRQAHGDLHLGNVVFEDEGPLLFDCIEFSERIGTIDLLYDLAFVLMDLAHRGLVSHANRLLNAYCLAASAPLRAETLAGLGTLPLFQSVRAGVRAHVSASMGQEEVARAYLEAAATFLDTSAPCLIAVGGLSGSGKSTLARAIAPGVGAPPGALHLRSDELRKRRWGVAAETQLPPEAYASEVTAEIYRQLCAEAETALSAGHSVVVDAVHARAEERAAIEGVATRRAIRFDGIWLEAPATALRSRVGSRKGDASDADAEVVNRQLRYDIGVIDWHRIDASETAERTVARARNALMGEGPSPTRTREDKV